MFKERERYPEKMNGEIKWGKKEKKREVMIFL
jgi:hypothetical protein